MSTTKRIIIKTQADAVAYLTSVGYQHLDSLGEDGRLCIERRCHRCGGSGIYTQYHGTCFACTGTRSTWIERPNVIAVARNHRTKVAARANRDAKRVAAATEAAAEGIAWLEANGMTEAVEGLDMNSSISAERILWGLGQKCLQFGCMTEKQAAFARSLIVQISERKVQDARKISAPTGRVAVTGQIVARKISENAYGSTDRITILVEVEAGTWTLNCTTPSAITGASPRRGDTVSLTATVEPSDTDPSFAFGKRPSKATLVKAPDAE